MTAGSLGVFELLYHRPGVLAEVLSEIVQGPRRRQFLADLGNGRIGWIAPRPTDARQAAVPGIEVGGHFTMIAVLTDVEPHVPMALYGFHTPMVGAPTRTDQSTTSLHVSAHTPCYRVSTTGVERGDGMDQSTMSATAAWYSAIRARWPSTSVGPALWVATDR